MKCKSNQTASKNGKNPAWINLVGASLHTAAHKINKTFYQSGNDFIAVRKDTTTDKWNRTISMKIKSLS